MPTVSTNPARPEPRPVRRGASPRICIVTETYFPVVGGGEKQAQMLAADLRANGVEVLIVTRRSDFRLPAEDEVDGVPVLRIPPVGPGRARRWGMMVAAIFVLAAARHRYDVLFVSGFKALGVSAVVVGKLFGKPCVLKADSNGELSGEFFAGGLKSVGLTPASPLFRLLLAPRNWILRRADAFVAITSGIVEEFTVHGIRPEVVRLVTNGVQTARFHPVSPDRKRALRRRLILPDREIVVAYTGRLVTYKGLPLLLEVAEQVARQYSDVGFVLVGSGGLDMHNCEAQLRRDVIARRLGDIVCFAGEVDNVHEYLQASDIYVLPTLDDAFPLALIEAMACGLPVVSTPVGGIVDIVADGENGLLVPAGDAARLLHALRRLIDGPALAQTLAAAGLQTVRDRFSSGLVAARYLDLFKRASRLPRGDMDGAAPLHQSR